MKKYFTLTLNPAIDKIIKLPLLKPNITTIVENKDYHQLYGGKGINASLILKTLGIDNCALGFLPSNDCASFANFLANYGITNDFIKVSSGNVRTNLKITSENDHNEYEINCPGFTVNEELIKQLIEQLQAKLMYDNTILLISGSKPPGANDDIYLKIIEKLFLNNNNLQFAIDIANNKLIKQILAYRPLLIKPNLEEFNQLIKQITNSANDDKQFHKEDEKAIIVAARKHLIMEDKGAVNVIVSCGSYGSYLITAKKAFFANIAPGKLVSSTGAGDSMFATFIAFYTKQKKCNDQQTATNFLKTAFQYAAAAGCATSYKIGIAEKHEIEALKDQIQIREIE